MLNGKVVTAGGSSNGTHSQQDILEYDPATDSWRTLGQLPVPLSATVADMLGGRLAVTGGSSEDSRPITETWLSR